jgi:hypothetical protein
LRALQLIETVGDARPVRIAPVVHAQGSVMNANDRMAAKVRWAEQANYAILTRDVPDSFAPYNAVIRVSESGTEDKQRDYLAQLVYELEVQE